MQFDDIRRAITRDWALLVVCTVLGALVGAGGYALSTPLYQSKARTSMAAAATEGDVEAVYQVTQAVRVMMPQYISWAQSDDVADRAYKAAGVPAGNITGVEVTATPDSSVLEWSMTGKNPDEVRRALDASTQAFGEAVRGASPTSKGQTVVTVRVDSAASEATRASLLSLPMALALGVAVGFLSALLVVLMRHRGDKRAYDAEEIERSLNTIVVGQLEPDQDQQRRAWDYVAAAVADRARPGQVTLLGCAAHPAHDDIERFENALADMAGRDKYTVVGSQIGGADLVHRIGESRAVVLFLVRGSEDLPALEPEVHSIKAICRGPVCAVLDVRHP